MIDSTLVFLLKGNPVIEVLLGYKKVGFGLGKYTGIGGKVEPGETAAEAALRELAEEIGVTIFNDDDLNFCAVLEFHFPHKKSWEQRVFVFTTHYWQGSPTESEEMIPIWFKVGEIPFEKMWDDAHYWLPKIIAEDRYHAIFTFRSDNQTVETVKFKQD